MIFKLKYKQNPAEKIWPADKEAEEITYAKAYGFKQSGRLEEMKSIVTRAYSGDKVA